MTFDDDIDPCDLIEFAKSYRAMGDAVAEQFNDLMNDEFDDINPNAVDVMRRFMKGYSVEIDDKLGEYYEWLAAEEAIDSAEQAKVSDHSETDLALERTRDHYGDEG